ncbi:MAG: RnfABCDGE type electron transport complex subunit B [Candidatus Sumerlaeia bacterium]
MWIVYLTPALVMGGLGLGVGVILFAASKKFAVKENPLVEEINEVLPGTNCGACGYAGCRSLAEAFAADPSLDAYCPVGGSDVAEKIASILGVEMKAAEKKVARILCGGTTDCASRHGVYEGIKDCNAVELVSASPKVCTYGCLGLGTCVKACPFDAIEVVNGVVRVNEEECTGCGVCVKACPRDCIELQGSNKTIWVACHSRDSGALVRKYCSVGCIGCKKCEKNCPTGAITVENFYAHIRQELCNDCGKCVELCPTSAILTKHQKEDVEDFKSGVAQEEHTAEAAQK